MGSGSPRASLLFKKLGPQVLPQPSSPPGAQSLSHGWLAASQAEEQHGSFSTGVQLSAVTVPKSHFIG